MWHHSASHGSCTRASWTHRRGVFPEFYSLLIGCGAKLSLVKVYRFVWWLLRDFHTLQQFYVVYSELNQCWTHNLFFHRCLYLLLMQLLPFKPILSFLLFMISGLAYDSHNLRMINSLLHIVIFNRWLSHASTLRRLIVHNRSIAVFFVIVIIIRHIGLKHDREQLVMIVFVTGQVIYAFLLPMVFLFLLLLLAHWYKVSVTFLALDASHVYSGGVGSLKDCLWVFIIEILNNTPGRTLFIEVQIIVIVVLVRLNLWLRPKRKRILLMVVLYLRVLGVINQWLDVERHEVIIHHLSAWLMTQLKRQERDKWASFNLLLWGWWWCHLRDI